MQKNLLSNGKTFPEHRSVFVTRQQWRRGYANALRRRLSPNTSLTRQQFAHAMGWSVDTVDNHLSEYGQPDAYRMGQAMSFFYSIGDHTFATEVYGDVITPLTKKAKIGTALAALDAAREALIAEEAVA